MTRAMALVEEAVAHQRGGRVDRAEAALRESLACEGAPAEALVRLVGLLLGSGRLDEAVALLRVRVAAAPDDATAHLALGSLRQAQGDVVGAIAMLRRAAELEPANRTTAQALGRLERDRGDLASAIRWFRRTAALAPDSGEAQNDLGATLVDAGRIDEGVVALRRALAAEPGRAAIHYNLGLAASAQGRLDDAIACQREAIRLDPAFASAWEHLAGALRTALRLDDAEAALHTALRLRPRSVAALGLLAGVHEWQARHDEAIACHRRAVALAPESSQVHGNLLYALLFHPASTPASLRAEHDAWDLRHGRPLAVARAPREPGPTRRLRIGYVCGLLRDHVLGRYLSPLLEHHDRTAFHVTLYANNAFDDATTERFRSLADAWRDIAHLDDEAVAAGIRDDRIDVLVDTTVHMERNRLPVFARRPAPVQATFAGYPGSTGLAAVDWRLTDPYLDPPGEHDDWTVERSWRLPSTFWCYAPPRDEDVAMGPLPCDTAGAITFGCLNNFAKVSEPTLDLWATLLRAVPDARLLLLAAAGRHRDRVLARLARQGVEPGRVAFADPAPRRDYLALFGRIDLSLDTLPYNGHTTSLDSLWMGVPVVTLVGRTVVGRAGLSILANLGLPELIATTPEQYVASATTLVADREWLRTLRRTLRDRMRGSALMDAEAFARGVEAAWLGMWASRGGTVAPSRESAHDPAGLSALSLKKP